MNKRHFIRSLVYMLGCIFLMSCTAYTPHEAVSDNAKHFGLVSTTEILLSSEQGHKMSIQDSLPFQDGYASGIRIEIYPEQVKQTLTGIGTSFTESSAFVLAHLEPAKRQEVMQNIYAQSGANFSIARTPIGSTDFSVEGKQSYADVAGDASLKHFSIAMDKDGFQKSRYPGIQDESFDVLPMIKEALAIKQNQNDKTLNIVASAWTAPAWMKDIEEWYINGTAETDWEGTGGQLKPEFVASYANYLIKYLDAYKAEGVDIWGMTPVNEPQGNSGQWESMHFTPQSQNDFIKNFLGPKLQTSRHADMKLLIYDQNRDHVEEWTDVILGDPETAQYVYGTAVHWYESTYQVNEDALERVHNKFPDFDIIHTEGTIDDLGKPAPNGVLDPVLFQESNWFMNDAFWWNKNATDWAYSATWAPNVEDHPVYTPVHRYARNIIVSLDNWMSGWIDWNVVLDHKGGPNHVGNFCGAPIMIDVNNGEVYYTPIYTVLAQFSRTIRPGDKAVQTARKLNGLDADALHASANINADNLLSVQLLNTTKQPIQFALQIGAQYTEVNMTANAVQTIRVQL
ncbi:MAG: glycosyl hydrolase [Gammaproteobacteria bacterium]|nr:glycosyl hydrolase [Gammaproteobacteria bacterium]NNC97457.1 glycosyl hydrolase [Gammaproteobacteria bacterium]NNM12984.1 glycosyl hydrolase [Gammaproteobacteria bacterium]